MSTGWLSEAKKVDTALYAAVAGTETPRLDVAMRRLSQVADHGVLWVGTAAVLALVGGSGGVAPPRPASPRWASPPPSPTSSASR